MLCAFWGWVGKGNTASAWLALSVLSLRSHALGSPWWYVRSLATWSHHTWKATCRGQIEIERDAWEPHSQAPAVWGFPESHTDMSEIGSSPQSLRHTSWSWVEHRWAFSYVPCLRSWPTEMQGCFMLLALQGILLHSITEPKQTVKWHC